MPSGPKIKPPTPIEQVVLKVDPPVHDHRSFHDDFPRLEGPPPIPAYGSAKVVSATERHYTVEIDEGAFRALWELIEADCVQRYPTRGTMTVVQARIRGVKAFRDAYWAQNEPRVAAEAPRVSPAPRKGLKRRRAS